MGDENKLTIASEEYANVTIGSADYYNDLITISGHGDIDFKYEDWLGQYDINTDLSDIDIGNWSYPNHPLGANNVTLTAAGDEMLRVAQDGFYVRGVKVEADAKEAKAVYEAFKQWMTYAILNGEINNR